MVPVPRVQGVCDFGAPSFLSIPTAQRGQLNKVCGLELPAEWAGCHKPALSKKTGFRLHDGQRFPSTAAS